MPVQTNNTTNQALVKYARLGVIICAVWGAAVATVCAMALYAFVSHTNLSPGEVATTTLLTWAFTFATAFFSAAFWIVVLAFLTAGVHFVFFANRNGNNDATPTNLG